MFAERLLHLFRHAGNHRRLENTRCNRVDADAELREFTCKRQHHGDDAALGCRIRGLADLPFESRNRCRADHNATLAIFVRVVKLHECGRFFRDVVAADQIDLNDTVEVFRRPWSVATQCASGGCDPGTIDREGDSAHELICALHGCTDRFLIGDVGLHEYGSLAESGGAGFTLFSIYVQQRRVTTGINDAFGGCEPEPRCAAGNHGLRSCKIHQSFPQSISIPIATASPPPMQSEATPRFLSCARNACSSVTMILAPLAPIG